MSNSNRFRYIGEAFFLCPIIFSNDDRNKFPKVMAYWLSQGVISHVVRDKFTSDGKGWQRGVQVPQIIDRAIMRKGEILDAAGRIEAETIQRYWNCKVVPKGAGELIGAWLDLVEDEYLTNVNGYSNADLKEHLGVLRSAFE